LKIARQDGLLRFVWYLLEPVLTEIYKRQLIFLAMGQGATVDRMQADFSAKSLSKYGGFSSISLLIVAA